MIFSDRASALREQVRAADLEDLTPPPVLKAALPVGRATRGPVSVAPPPRGLRLQAAPTTSTLTTEGAW